MTSTRCAVCKYFRRRCPPDCIFAPYFPASNPQKFIWIHKIHGASNLGKMLEEVPVNLRNNAVESLYFEAKCRIKDPVYGCVAIISNLHQQIHTAESQLALAQTELAILQSNVVVAEQTPSLDELLVRQNRFDCGLDDPSNTRFY